MARTPKTGEDRREQLIQAALVVFARKGFAEATNKDIAEEAGITPGLIYHYFKSKHDLLRAAIEEYSPRQLLRSLPPEMLELPIADLLGQVASRILTLAEGEDFLRLIRVYLPEVIRNPAVAPSGISTIQEVVRFLEKALATSIEKGEIRAVDPALTAQLFLGTIMDIVLRRQIMRDPLALRYTQEQIVENIVTTALSGLTPR